MNIQTPTSPLAEASPESLQELFDRDPLQLTNSDIETIVTELRSMRDRWVQSEAKTRGKKVAAPKNLSLADLDLEL